MKNIVILIFVFLPILTFAQKKNKKPVGEVMAEYSKRSNFNYFEVSKDLIAEMVKSGNIHSKSKERLLKIQRIRLLEADTTYYKKLLPEDQAVRFQLKQDKNGTVIIKDGDSIISPINVLADNNLEAIFDFNNWFYNTFINEIDISQYNVILSQKKKRSNVLFLKKSIIGQSTTEYLLITDLNVIQIIGEIDLKAVSEIKQIVDELANLTF